MKKETRRASMREKDRARPRETKEKAKDFNQMLWFDVGWQPVSM